MSEERASPRRPWTSISGRFSLKKKIHHWHATKACYVNSQPDKCNQRSYQNEKQTRAESA